MLTLIQEETELHKAFEAYEEIQNEIRKLNNAITMFQQKQAPHKKLIDACVRRNGGEVVCGKFKAKVQHVKESVRNAYDFVKVTY